MEHNFYGFLMAFTRGTTPGEEYLINKFGKDKLKEAIDKRYITEYGVNNAGDKTYIITNKGIEVRDV